MASTDESGSRIVPAGGGCSGERTEVAGGGSGRFADQAGVGALERRKVLFGAASSVGDAAVESGDVHGRGDLGHVNLHTA